eukprot:4930285-Amphidinium_carterae.1
MKYAEPYSVMLLPCHANLHLRPVLLAAGALAPPSAHDRPSKNITHSCVRSGLLADPQPVRKGVAVRTSAVLRHSGSV